MAVIALVKILTTFTIVTVAILPGTPQVYAQPSRDCASTASDPDGDGFGWEWNADAGQLASCVITEESYAPPSPIFNRETGEEIRLIRPYWNANRDIAGRDIECKGYDFDETEGRYTNQSGRYDTNLSHDALPLSPPYMAAADFDKNPYFISPDMVIYKVWTVIDGRYIGPMMGRMSVNYTTPIFDWLEIIDATDTAPAGIRIWGSRPTYRECFDKSGQSFGPTGFIGEEFPANEIQDRSLIATGISAPAQFAETPVNLETGQPVNLTTAYWDVYESSWGRAISCWPTQWDGSNYFPQFHSGVLNYFYEASTGEQSGFVGTRFGLGGGDGGTSDERSVVDGKFDVSGFWSITIYDKLEVIPPTEDINGHVRSWHTSESYTVCMDTGGLAGPYNTSDRRDLMPLDPSTIQTNNEPQDNNSTNTQDPVSSPTQTQDPETNTDSTTNNTGTQVNSDFSGGGAMEIGLMISLLLLSITRRRTLQSGATL